MPLDHTRIRALCFDVDGTLSDTDDQFVAKLVRLLTPLRFLFPGRDPRPFARKFVMMTESPGNYVYGIPDRLGIDAGLAAGLSALGDSVYRLGLGRTHAPFLLVPGVMDALERLRSRFPMAIVSARGGKSTQRFLEQFQLTPFFECVATAQTCEHTKPYPDPILWAAGQVDVPPPACLMIGDTTVDILAARAAGAQSVGVLCGFGEEAELRRAGADLILKSTAFLADELLT